MHKLEGGYTITKVSGKDCRYVLRDKYAAPLVVLEMCNGMVSNVRGYKNVTYPEKYRPILIKFLRAHHYALTEEAAVDLGLSIVRIEDEDDLYLTSSELRGRRLNEILRNPGSVDVTFNSFSRRRLSIPSGTKNCSLNFTHAAVKKLVVSSKVNASIDLRDNQYTETLIIEDGFNGSLNLSRSNLDDIRIADNCRCDLLFNYSGKCFDMRIGDVFSGLVDIRNSCFHYLDVGYYCYADIQLSENWGRRSINIGDSFRGTLQADSVMVKEINIGNDCKGKIIVSSKDSRQGTSHIEVADEFNGELDLQASRTVKHIDIGSNSRGRLNMLGCPSLEAVKIAEDFGGTADFSESGLIYLQARKGCRGRFVLLNCNNLMLLKLPNNRKSDITVERSPLEVRVDDDNVYYHFQKGKIPEKYAETAYMGWYNKAKKFLKKHLHVCF